MVSENGGNGDIQIIKDKSFTMSVTASSTTTSSCSKMSIPPTMDDLVRCPLLLLFGDLNEVELGLLEDKNSKLYLIACVVFLQESLKKKKVMDKIKPPKKTVSHSRIPMKVTSPVRSEEIQIQNEDPDVKKHVTNSLSKVFKHTFRRYKKHVIENTNEKSNVTDCEDDAKSDTDTNKTLTTEEISSSCEDNSDFTKEPTSSKRENDNANTDFSEMSDEPSILATKKTSFSLLRHRKSFCSFTELMNTSKSYKIQSSLRKAFSLRRQPSKISACDPEVQTIESKLLKGFF